MRSILSLVTKTGLLLTALTVFTTTAVAKKDGPTITSSSFENTLDNVFYFDDSNVILGQDKDAGIIYRSADAGSKWEAVVSAGQNGHVWDLWPHPWNNQRAYAIGDGSTHWMTKDQGKTWAKFNPGSEPNYEKMSPLSFHGRNPKKVIWNGLKCLSSGFSCSEVAVYTEDDFETTDPLGKDALDCYWAVGTPMFAEEIATVVDDRIFCIKAGLYSMRSKDHRLVVSDDYFRDQEIEPALDGGRAVSGVISMAAVKGYVVAAAKSEGTDELALYVSDDSSTWHRAVFGQHKVLEEAYTILESTNYSMQVDVLGSRPMNPMGFLYTSNSNGTYFTRNIDYTNRSPYGRVDFEKVANIQGIVLVNVVDNHAEVEKSVSADKQIISQISFDDGRTFQDIMSGSKKLHLHSVTDAKQGGRMFSSPAPGIVMGVGNTGKFLKKYEEGDLYVSDDAGVTWQQALDGAHLYEFGNYGAVLVAVDDEEATDHVRYSLDHGKTWKKADLEKKVRAKFLTTAPDSTTLSFLLGGTSGTGSKAETLIFKIDFEGLHERTCGDKDFEKWPARVDQDGEPSCIMGHKQFYRRRKADADCVVDGEFQDPVPEFVPCVCTEADFECDFNFARDPSDRSKCLPSGPLKIPEGKCKNDKDTFVGNSGWRLIPGNECIRKNGVELDKDIERPCADTVKKPASDQIEVEKTAFNADTFAEWYYLERSDTSLGDDETLVMRTSEQNIYITRDHGKTWNPILEKESITAIMPNPHYHDAVYFLTGSTKVHYTIDRGESFHDFKAEARPSHGGLPPLKFHPDYKDWMLWSGEGGSTNDHTDIFITKDRGGHWEYLARYAKKCDFIHREEKDTLIYCEQFQDENPKKNLQLVSSDDFFAKSEVKFPDILDYATMAEFIIVATKVEDQQSLRVDASVDGETFAAAEFPRNFQVAHQQAYTVLDSSTHAVFLHVTVNNIPDQEYGTIIKSNSNGTSYVLTLNAVNRDTSGYVDFEKMQGLEGVAMVNVVANTQAAEGGGLKKLKSMITHNDGAEWALLPPPKVDAVGKNYDCVGTANVATEKCALHVHSYTERTDKSATFSSPSAVGMMMAVGNVGEFLARKDSEETDTFITRDAGITWKSVKKGSYMWEYGDQGSIIVIVLESKPTKSIFYTLDEGETWSEFEFTAIDTVIDAITTVPSDMSRNFLLWGRETGSGAKRGQIVTINLDFSGLKSRQRQCDLDEDHPENQDYELWEPKHPMQSDNCLFGHVAQYHRKIVDADCYNGKKITHLHSISRNCSCTRQDFECDYNFQIQADGTCKLVEGLEPPDHELNCKKNPKQIEFYYPTGYRKIPLSTCEGGQDLEKINPQPCPGHENEFEREHGLGGAGLFFAIVIPIIAAGGIGYWVWKTYQERGFGGFGAIRLGESLSASAPRVGGGQSPLITIPVTIIAGVVAVAKALPLLVTSLFRSAKGYVPVGSNGSAGYGSGPYRSRDAFANRRPDLAGAAYVEDDELLGDDDDDAEEV